MFFNKPKNKTLDTKTMMRLISRGEEAGSLMRTLAPRIQDWKNWVFDSIASAEPDGMVYAKYAGMIEMLRTMEKELYFQKSEGDQAMETLESQKKKTA